MSFKKCLNREKGKEEKYMNSITVVMMLSEIPLKEGKILPKACRWKPKLVTRNIFSIENILVS